MRVVAHFFLRLIFAIGTVLTILVAVPFAIIAVAFWAAEGSWDFEGYGVRYWMFVQGSRVERLGTVEQTGGATKYSVRLQEGTFPGWIIASYESAAPPEKIISIYGERCMRLKLKIIENKSATNSGTGALRAEMTCEIEKYLDIEILAERDAAAATTRVFIKAWGE